MAWLHYNLFNHLTGGGYYYFRAIINKDAKRGEKGREGKDRQGKGRERKEKKRKRKMLQIFMYNL